MSFANLKRNRTDFSKLVQAAQDTGGAHDTAPGAEAHLDTYEDGNPKCVLQRRHQMLSEATPPLVQHIWHNLHVIVRT